MQDIQVDNNFRSTEKFEKLNLDSQIYFYEFLNLTGIYKMNKQDMLKKVMGQGSGSEPGRPKSIGLPGPC
jgi:hypothetical protein